LLHVHTFVVIFKLSSWIVTHIANGFFYKMLTLVMPHRLCLSDQLTSAINASRAVVRMFCFDGHTVTTATVLRPLYRTTCISRNPQLRTAGFFSSIVLLPACCCWQPYLYGDFAGCRLLSCILRLWLIIRLYLSLMCRVESVFEWDSATEEEVCSSSGRRKSRVLCKTSDSLESTAWGLWALMVHSVEMQTHWLQALRLCACIRQHTSLEELEDFVGTVLLPAWLC